MFRATTVSRKTYIPIGVQPGTRLAQLRYEQDTGNYIIWIAHDRLIENGTFLLLKPGGKIQRVTVYPDNSEEIKDIT